MISSLWQSGALFYDNDEDDDGCVEDTEEDDDDDDVEPAGEANVTTRGVLGVEALVITVVSLGIADSVNDWHHNDMTIMLVRMMT